MHVWVSSHTKRVPIPIQTKASGLLHLFVFLDLLLALSLLTGVFVVEPEEASSGTRTLRDPDSLLSLSMGSWPALTRSHCRHLFPQRLLCRQDESVCFVMKNKLPGLTRVSFVCMNRSYCEPCELSFNLNSCVMMWRTLQTWSLNIQL